MAALCAPPPPRHLDWPHQCQNSAERPRIEESRQEEVGGRGEGSRHASWMDRVAGLRGVSQMNEHQEMRFSVHSSWSGSRSQQLRCSCLQASTCCRRGLVLRSAFWRASSGLCESHDQAFPRYELWWHYLFWQLKKWESVRSDLWVTKRQKFVLLVSSCMNSTELCLRFSQQETSKGCVNR